MALDPHLPTAAALWGSQRSQQECFRLPDGAILTEPKRSSHAQLLREAQSVRRRARFLPGNVLQEAFETDIIKAFATTVAPGLILDG